MSRNAIGINVAAIGVSRVAALVLDGLAYVVLARYLGPGPYGHYVTIFAFLSLVDLAADMMTLDVSVREIAAAPERTNAWLSAATVVRLALALVGLVAFGAYAFWTGIAMDPATSAAAAVATFLLPVGALRTPLVAFRAHMRMHYELAIIVATRAVNLALLAAVAVRGGTLVQLFAVTVASRALLAVLGWTLVFRQFRFAPVIDLQAIRHLIRESLPMGISGVCVAAQLKGDIMLVGAMMGAHAAGLYGVVAQLPEYLLYVPVIFTTPALPVLSQCMGRDGQRDMHEFQRLYQGMFDTVMSLVIPIAVLGIVVPDRLVSWTFGAAFTPAASVLPLMMLSVVCMWFSHATAIATVAARLQGHFVWIQAVCVAAFFGLAAVLIPASGIAGAAIARLVAAAIAPVLTYVLLRRRIGITLSARLLARCAGAAVVMAIGVSAVAGQHPMVLAGVGVALYTATLWLTGANPFTSLVQKELAT